MDILGQKVDLAISDKVQEDLSQTIAKPLTTTACAYILSRYWYLGIKNNFFGFEINDRIIYSSIVGLTSFFESTLRQYLLPNIIGSKLAGFTIDVTSPFVIGVANLLVNEGLAFYNFGESMSTRGLMYAFGFGFLSEIAGKWLYDTVIKKLTSSMLV